MKASLYWIDVPGPGRLAIAPRPRGGEWLAEEVNSWANARGHSVVSMLTKDEALELDLKAEQAECQKHGIEYISFPVLDRGVPASRSATLKLARVMHGQLAKGKGIVIHCRAGIGRAALFAACTLALSGMDSETAFCRISASRGCEVPDTSEQRTWVAEWVRTIPVQAT